MEIIEKKMQRIDLVRFNEIPFLILANKKVSEHLSENFSFSDTEFGRDPITNELRLIRWLNGYLNFNGNKIFIENLTIEERKIIFKIVGLTEFAAQFYEELKKFLSSITPMTEQKDFLEPLVTAYESEIIAKMDFNYKNIFSDQFCNLIDVNLYDEVKSDIAEPTINFSNVNFLISYDPFDSKLSDYKISLSKKIFSIAAAPGYPLNEKTFIFSAPVRCEELIKLTETFEDSI
ncbi:MAG: hypothetical protein GYA51_19345 [Candidatus Methanofastidiosa archaeon]|nr:hypothetical protein [Candidatus Methanofastidiosa archaeon]